MRKFITKHYDNNGYFRGVLDVVNEIVINKEINTSGSQVTIDIAISLEESGAAVYYNNIVDEYGNNIVTEDGDYLIWSSEVRLESIPTLGHRIEISEVSDTNPAGSIIFKGIVSKWESKYSDNKTTITVLSDGVRLDNYMIQILPNTELTGYDEANYDSDLILYNQGYKYPYNRVVGAAQSFKNITDSDVQSITVYLANSGSVSTTARLSLYSGVVGAGTLLSSITRSIAGSSAYSMVEFILPSAIAITGGADYYFTVFNDETGGMTETNILKVGYDSGGGYTSGAKYEYNDSSGYSAAAGDLLFSIKTATGAAGNVFNTYDPSDIVRELLDNFQALGGDVGYTASSIDDTSTDVSYTFKYSTYYEGIKKCIELSPGNWYWYVDLGTNTLYYKPKPTTASHTFTYGKDAGDITVWQSLEDVKNVVYFSGGDTGGGVNLQIDDSDIDSIALYGQWLESRSDNRVTDTTSAQIIVDGVLDSNSTPKYAISELTILSSEYDISTIHIGQLVKFRNFNSIINSLELQIMAITYTENYAILKLEVLPPTQAKRVEDIKRNLIKQQTENNPAV